MTINLDKYSFDEWVKFVFDHPVPADIQKSWYWDDEWEWEGDPIRVLEYSIRLFRNPEFLLDRYTPEQINQGFWFLLGATNQLQDWIWDEAIDWRIRKECIISVIDVFDRLFTKNPIEESCYMWWDHLRNFKDNPDTKVKEAMLEALSQILRINSHDCQVSALHGLGHLEHEGKKKLIEEYLNANPNLDAEMRGYAMAAIEGRVL